MNRNSRIAAVALVLAGTQGHAQTIYMDGNRLVEDMLQFEQSQRNAPNSEFKQGVTWAMLWELQTLLRV